MNIPKIGDKVSLWVEGIVRSTKTDWSGTTIEVYNKKTTAHCFVPLKSIEPTCVFDKPFRQTLREIIAEEYEGVEE